MKNSEYNKWRESLPASCWDCERFDKCHPKYECNQNPLYTYTPKGEENA